MMASSRPDSPMDATPTCISPSTQFISSIVLIMMSDCLAVKVLVLVSASVLVLGPVSGSGPVSVSGSGSGPVSVSESDPSGVSKTRAVEATPLSGPTLGPVGVDSGDWD